MPPSCRRRHERRAALLELRHHHHPTRRVRSLSRGERSLLLHQPRPGNLARFRGVSPVRSSLRSRGAPACIGPSRARSRALDTQPNPRAACRFPRAVPVLWAPSAQGSASRSRGERAAPLRCVAGAATRRDPSALLAEAARAGPARARGLRDETLAAGDVGLVGSRQRPVHDGPLAAVLNDRFRQRSAPLPRLPRAGGNDSARPRSIAREATECCGRMSCVASRLGRAPKMILTPRGDNLYARCNL